MTVYEDRTGLIELSSGNFFSVLDPDPMTVTLGDVAHGLSLTCRFSGQSCHFYSVAEHCLLVSDRLRGEAHTYEIQLAGLTHDAAEAFVTDVPRPAKHLMPGYNEIEDRVLVAVLKSFQLEDLPVHCESVKEADQWALAQEAGELMPSTGKYWRLGYDWDGEDRGLGAEPPERVKTKWTRRYRYLYDKIGAV